MMDVLNVGVDRSHSLFLFRSLCDAWFFFQTTADAFVFQLHAIAIDSDSF